MYDRNPRRFALGMAVLLVLVAVLSSCRVEDTPEVPTAPTSHPPAAASLQPGTPSQPAFATPYLGPLAELPPQPTARPSGPTVYPGPTVGSTPRPSAPATLPPRPSPTTPPASPAPTRGEVAFTLTILHTGEVQGEVLPCG